MNQYSTSSKVIFKLGNLILSGKILYIMNCQDWVKDDAGNPIKIEAFKYYITTIVGGTDVDEKNIIKIA